MYVRRGMPQFRHTELRVETWAVGDGRFLYGTPNHLYAFDNGVNNDFLSRLPDCTVSYVTGRGHVPHFERGRVAYGCSFSGKVRHAPRGFRFRDDSGCRMGDLVIGRNWGVIDVSSDAPGLLEEMLRVAVFSQPKDLVVLADSVPAGLRTDWGLRPKGREFTFYTSVQEAA